MTRHLAALVAASTLATVAACAAAAPPITPDDGTTSTTTPIVVATTTLPPPITFPTTTTGVAGPGTPPDPAPPPTLPPAPPCSTWPTQADANAWADTNRHHYDMTDIDTDGDGKPCELHYPPPTTGLAPTGTAPPPEAVPAATTSNFDALALCESGGNWAHPPVYVEGVQGHFSGGIMFHEVTWRGFGGTQYASAAHLASREAQIAVAERVLAVQGRNAWPGCTAAGRW